MNPDHQLVDAMIDHEDVDVARLRRVLEDPGARDYLIDACLLRRAMLTEGLEPGEVTASRQKSRPAARRHGLLLTLGVAASLAIAFIAGRATASPDGSAPGDAASLTPVAARDVPAFPAPAATRVIQVEFAPATSGGN
jgi:hypothetical protein